MTSGSEQGAGTNLYAVFNMMLDNNVLMLIFILASTLPFTSSSNNVVNINTIFILLSVIVTCGAYGSFTYVSKDVEGFSGALFLRSIKKYLLRYLGLGAILYVFHSLLHYISNAIDASYTFQINTYYVFKVYLTVVAGVMFYKDEKVFVSIRESFRYIFRVWPVYVMHIAYYVIMLAVAVNVTGLDNDTLLIRTAGLVSKNLIMLMGFLYVVVYIGNERRPAEQELSVETS